MDYIYARIFHQCVFLITIIVVGWIMMGVFQNENPKHLSMNAMGLKLQIT